jgi:uncharacterized glyoxalase superfamily protein PhnB
MRRGQTSLCFWPGNEFVYKQTYFRRFPKNTPRGYGVELVIMVRDIDTVYRKARKFARIVDSLKRKPWGLRDFRLVDPFGFYIRFTEPHDILDPNNAVG